MPEFCRQKLTLLFDFHHSDGLIPTSPACKRAVDEAVDAAKAAGHEVIPVDLPDRKPFFP
jgi:Asp-tRNA(Asn)/Glu-tRNA(Gln) amidotransferase A subunit family amidase